MKNRYIVWAMIALLLVLAVVIPASGTLAVMIATAGEASESLMSVEEPAQEAPAVSDEQPEVPAGDDVVIEEPAENETPAEEPVEDDAVTEAPTEEETETEEPVEDDAVAEEPVEDDAVVEEPVEDDVVTEEPTEDDAVVEEPAEDDAVVEEPAEDDVVTEDAVQEEEQDELVVGLTTAVNHLFVGDGKIALHATIEGGRPPYRIALKVENSGDTVADYAAQATYYAENAFSYEPKSWGTHVLTVKVEDADGKTDRAAVTVHVAEREGAYEGAWEKTFDDVKLTGDWRADIVSIARTQLGYEESEKNFIIDEAGVKRAYTRYGEWYGAPYSEWCGMFAAFCIRYAGIGSGYPVDAHVGAWAEKLGGVGALEDNDLEYVPTAGDLIFFDWDRDGEADHMGIVEKVDGYSVFTIQGNAEGMVRRVEYSLGDNDIYAYGSTAELMRQAGLDVTDEVAIEEAEDEPELTVIGSAVTTKGGVNVRNRADGQYVIAQIAKSGTEVQVYGVETAGGNDWYHIKSGGVVGYVRGDLIAMDEAEEAPQAEEAVIEETQELEENEEAEAPVFTVALEGDDEELNFGEEFVARGVVADEEEMPEPMTQKEIDIAAWVEETNPSPEMIQRAQAADSLDSVVMEGDQFIHVRSGDVLAYVENGMMIDVATGLTVATVDVENGMIYPISAQ